jgi:ribosome biogenesis GTPase
MDLQSLGADAGVFGAFQKFSDRGLVLGRVATAQRDLYRVYTETGEVFAEPSGALWYSAPDRASMPVVGDWVATRLVGADQAIVEAVLPRRTCFARRAAGKREDRQPIAANLDLIFLVCGLDGDFNLRRLERYLTIAAESGAKPVLVLNKSDLCPEAVIRERETAEIAGGAPIVVMSAQNSADALAGFLAPGRTVALVGSSGVGKSTIVNRLVGEERLKTSEVRESDSRGRHTTSHRELVPLPAGGALIDTPGMRELQLWAGEESVDRAFEDIAEIAAGCRYRDCSHSGESGCAVSAALEAGTLAAERWNSYRKLQDEVRRHQLMADPNAARERKKKWKSIAKAIRQHYRMRE